MKLVQCLSFCLYGVCWSDCGCNGHAVSCHYDEEKGYGVCDDCQEETSGDKCEYCQRLYYINPEKDNMTQAEAQLMCQGVATLTSLVFFCVRSQQTQTFV